MTDRRCVTRWIAPIVTVVGGLLAGTIEGAQNSKEQQTIQVFSESCESETNAVDGKPFVKVQFASVRRLASNESPRFGTWRYAYETDDQQYPDNIHVMGPGDNQIELVSTLRPPMSGNLPPYLWHVISVPSPGAVGAGFIARYREFTKKYPGVWEPGEYLDLRKSNITTDKGEFLFYVKKRLPESVTSNITRLWSETFNTAMRFLVLEHYQSDSRTYTHTFVYLDAPKAAGDINRDVGGRRNSSRTVRAPGMAFGFVLDDAGRCLASTTLTIAVKD